ncbi:MAG: PIN domain-containing protein [Anaerolineales bacterium]|nr:PIN domain-containing protein [Anaerolineales bacterium]
MTARSFADTNVVVYTLDADTNKRHAAISVMRAHPVISVQVINEFLSVATGKMKLPRTTANRLAQILMKRCEVFDLTVEVVRHAISLGERHQLSHWDALIVASALHAGCDTLYSEDLQDGQMFEDRLKVNNPFATGR